MRDLCYKCLALIILLTAGCRQESSASDVEYEFLTPQLLVVKSSSGYGNVSHFSTAGNNIVKISHWNKENGLKRDKKGNILKKADIECFTYLQFAEPFMPGEKRDLNICTVQYDPEIPSKIFKLNQLGNGSEQKQKYAG